MVSPTALSQLLQHCNARRLTCRYSFDHGPLHFLQFSTEHDFSPGSEQFAWILRDLKSVNRTKTPWLVAGFHRPFYTDSVYGNSDTGDVGFTEDIRNALERLFFQFQVGCCSVLPHCRLLRAKHCDLLSALQCEREGLGGNQQPQPLLYE